jgi:sugar/nucleoside kinase (ribokinase family)
VRPLVVVGSLSRDVVAGGPARVGGAPFWCGIALQRLDRLAAVVARCALADAAALVPAVEALGVPLAVVPGRATPAFSFAYEGDLRRMTIDAVAEPWSVRQLAAVPDDATAVHVGALFADEFPPETLEALARDDRIVSLDGQGLVRVPRRGPLELRAPSDMPRRLAAIDILKLSVEEAEALLGEVTRERLAALDVPEVVVTYGSRGAAVWADGRLEHVPPPRVVDADPTGCGDAFAVGYLAARADGAAPVSAAEAAAALVVDLLASPTPQ